MSEQNGENEPPPPGSHKQLGCGSSVSPSHNWGNLKLGEGKRQAAGTGERRAERGEQHPGLKGAQESRPERWVLPRPSHTSHPWARRVSAAGRIL